MRRVVVGGLALLFGAVRAFGQVLVAGSGYSIATSGIAAAPGQIITVSLYGIAPRALDPEQIYAAGSGLLTSLAGQNSGISAQLNQTAEPKQAAVAVYAVQQPKCSDPCTPVTAVTLRIPFELQVPASGLNIASIRILDQGKAIGDVALSPVLDNVHFGNSCDQTAVFVPALGAAANPGCVALIQHANGQIVTAANPAHWGEVMLGWAYGLGALVSLGAPGLDGTPVAATSTLQTFDLGFNVQPNAAPSRPFHGEEVAHPAFTGVQGFSGLYHVNFVLPAVAPAGLLLPCDGVAVRSNLTVTVAGARSMDGAAICVAP